jgi:hypothetical protein
MREPDGASATGLVDDNTGDMVGTRGSTDSSTGDMVGGQRSDSGMGPAGSWSNSYSWSDIESVYRCATSYDL